MTTRLSSNNCSQLVMWLIADEAGLVPQKPASCCTTTSWRIDFHVNPRCDVAIAQQTAFIPNKLWLA